MKNLELNGLGVQEMNAEEMSCVNGGVGGLLGDVYEVFSWVAGWYIPHAQKHPDMSATLMNCM